MTLLALRTQDSLMAVRFAWSPAWETMAAVRTLVDDRARSYHEPWHRLVGERVARLDLAPLLAVEPLWGFVPDFLTPPPRTAWPRLRDQLAEIRATPPAQVAHELQLCRETVEDDQHRRPPARGLERARRAVLDPRANTAGSRHRAALPDACAARPPPCPGRAPPPDPLDQARPLGRRPQRPHRQR